MSIIVKKKCLKKPSKYCLSFNISDKEKKNEKERYLNNYKSNLIALLATIKNYQISILTDYKRPSFKDIKNILLKLIQNLQRFKKEQISDIRIWEQAITNKKNSLQNQIFIDYKNDQLIKNKKISVKKFNSYNLNSELNFLKFLNFKAENDIKTINNIIYKISNDYNYLNMCMKYLSIEEKENICVQPKYQPFISNILHKQIGEIRKKFKLIVSAKKIQNEEIEETRKVLNKLKNFILRKNIGLMNNYEIIKEESKEYNIQSLSHNQINNHINGVESIYNKNEEKDKKENYNDNVIIIDINNDKEDEKSELNSQIISFPKIEKNKNISIHNIHPAINLNINLKLNLDKIPPYPEKVIYNSQRNNQDNINNLYNIKRKKGLSSTGSLPYFMVNEIKEKIRKNSRNINKSKLKGINSFEKNNSNSNEILAKEYLVTI